jgi:hypothetical protein
MSEVRGKCVLMFTWCKRFADKGKWDNLQTSSARQVRSHVHLVQAVCRQRKVRQFADLKCEASVLSCSLGASGLPTKESETICRPPWNYSFLWRTLKWPCCCDCPEQSRGIYSLERADYSCTCLRAALLGSCGRKIWVLYCAHKPSGRLLTPVP